MSCMGAFCDRRYPWTFLGAGEAPRSVDCSAKNREMFVIDQDKGAEEDAADSVNLSVNDRKMFVFDQGEGFVSYSVKSRDMAPIGQV